MIVTAARRVLIALAAVLLVSALLGARWWAGRRSDAGVRGYVCGYLGSESKEKRAAQRRFCHRKAKDAFSRAPLPSGTLPDDRAYRAADNAICPPDRYACIHPLPLRPAGDADVALVRRALDAHLFEDVTVRLTGPEDPAPDGAVVFAVRIGEGACAVGYAEIGVGARVDYVGLLPDGRCLAG